MFRNFETCDSKTTVKRKDFIKVCEQTDWKDLTFITGLVSTLGQFNYNIIVESIGGDGQGQIRK